MKPFPDTIKALTPSTPRDFSDPSNINSVELKTSSRGFPIVDGKHLRSEEDVVHFITAYKNTFVCCTEGDLDSLLSFCNYTVLKRLELFGQARWCGYIVRKRPAAINLQKGRNSYWVWNLVSYPKEDTISVEEIQELLLYTLAKYKVPITTLLSPGALARGNLVSYREIREELQYVASLSTDLLQFFHKACFGPRHETDRLGQEYQYHYDMEKAHLAILEKTPSLIGLKILRDTYHEEAVFGAYQIDVTIPKSFKFSPIGTRDTDLNRVLYLNGHILGIYSHQYVQLLRSQGLNPKIIKSYEFIGEPTYYPYMRWSENIRRILKDLSNLLIDLRFLYVTIAGSAISTNRTVDEMTGEITWESNNTFNPILYSRVLGDQTCTILRHLQELGSDARAIRADEFSCTKRLKDVPEGLKEKESGDTVYIDNKLKGLPDGSTIDWAGWIKDYLDKPYIEYPIAHQVTLKTYQILGKRIGAKVDYTQRIRPSHGYRKGKEVTRMGDLLEGTYISTTTNRIHKYAETPFLGFPNA